MLIAARSPLVVVALASSTVDLHLTPVVSFLIEGNRRQQLKRVRQCRLLASCERLLRKASMHVFPLDRAALVYVY